MARKEPMRYVGGLEGCQIITPGLKTADPLELIVIMTSSKKILLGFHKLVYRQYAIRFVLTTLNEVRVSTIGN